MKELLCFVFGLCALETTEAFRPVLLATKKMDEPQTVFERFPQS